MITAVIETLNDEVALAHALAALVPAATEGVLREVVVIDRGSTDGTLVVADAAGCAIVDAAKASGDPLRLVAERARGNWLLLLPPAVVLKPGWQTEAMAFVDRALIGGRGMTAIGRFHRGRLVPGWWAWLGERWRRLVGAPQGGVLVSKDGWLALTAPSPVSSASSVSGVRRGAA
jgi:glycosyltransferase involved in cell wall biosynthesis